MKVFIGKYVNWIGPYQLANTIPFISEDTSEKIGDWLAKTRVNDLCEWLHSKKDRKIKVRIDPYDTWSMDNTLAHIILPMLKQLKETKHGSPMVDDEDLPVTMRYTSKKGPDDWETEDHWIHHKWDWVLNEMIWAFEQELDDSWEDKFRHGEPQYVYTPVDPKKEYNSVNFENDSSLTDVLESDWVRMDQVNPDYYVDYEGIKEYSSRIQNGFRLFGKYYSNLWD